MHQSVPAWRRVLRAVLTAALAVLLIALFYVAVVMGQPQGSVSAGVEPRMDQPLLSPLPSALLITDNAQLSRLTEAFPAPVMHPLYGDSLTFVEGLCCDLSFEGGLGRRLTLTYRTDDYHTLTVTSIYPARALALVGKEDYTFSQTAGQKLAGLPSVRMENASAIRLHSQGEEALYVLTAPKVPDAELRRWTAAMQLLTGNE